MIAGAELLRRRWAGTLATAGARRGTRNDPGRPSFLIGMRRTLEFVSSLPFRVSASNRQTGSSRSRGSMGQPVFARLRGIARRDDRRACVCVEHAAERLAVTVQAGRDVPARGRRRHRRRRSRSASVLWTLQRLRSSSSSISPKPPCDIGLQTSVSRLHHFARSRDRVGHRPRRRRGDAGLRRHAAWRASGRQAVRTVLAEVRHIRSRPRRNGRSGDAGQGGPSPAPSLSIPPSRPPASPSRRQGARDTPCSHECRRSTRPPRCRCHAAHRGTRTVPAPPPSHGGGTRHSRRHR